MTVQGLKQGSGILRTGLELGSTSDGLVIPGKSLSFSVGFGYRVCPAWGLGTARTTHPPYPHGLQKLLSLFLGGCVSRAIDSWLLISQPSAA